MQDESKVHSVEPGEKVGDSQRESEGTNQTSGASEDSVKYDTYRRTLSEAKKYKSIAQELEEKYQELEQRQLQAEGRKDELIEKLKLELDQTKGKLKTAVGSFAKSKAFDVITDEAVKIGCTSTKLLKKMVEEKISSLDFDENFNPSRDQVKEMLLELKQEEPILFSKEGPKIPPHFPKDQNYDPKAPDLSSMTKAQLLELAKKL